MKKGNSKSVWEGSLNTLAQNGTDNTFTQTTIIAGEGSELGNDKSIKGRAKRKLLSQILVLSLIEISEKKEAYETVKSLWNTYHCQNRIYSYQDRLYGQYCKNRFCTLCCSIRKADIINRYFPIISKWEQPYFVTLTVKSINKDRLPSVIKKMLIGFERIKDRYRKRSQRGGNFRMIGIKSLECNFNSDKRTYNPHFHLIVATKEIAEILITDWLDLWGKKWALRPAQNMQPVQNLESALIEIIKYGSKIFTEPDVNKKSAQKVNTRIYAAGLYNIFEAMKGKRIFDRFGFNLPLNSKKAPKGARLVKDFGEWIYSPENHDWLNSENELILSGFSPNTELINLLSSAIDKQQE